METLCTFTLFSNLIFLPTCPLLYDYACHRLDFHNEVSITHPKRARLFKIDQLV